MRPRFRPALTAAVLAALTAAPGLAQDNTPPVGSAFLVGDCNGALRSNTVTNTTAPVVSFSVRDSDSGLRIGQTPIIGDTQALAGTVLLLNFDEAAGNYLDHSGFYSTGVPNATTYGAASVNPSFGKAVGFTGAAGQQVKIAASPALNSTTSQITLQAWVNVADASPRPVLEYNDAISFGVHMWVNFPSTGALFANFVDTPATANHTVFSAAGLVSSGSWHLVTATYDGTFGALYVDSVQAVTSNLGSFILSTGKDLYAGRRITTGDVFNGTIDQARVLNVPLPSQAVAQDFYSGVFRLSTSGVNGPYADTQLVSASYAPAAANGATGLETVQRAPALAPNANNFIQYKFGDQAGNFTNVLSNIIVAISSPATPTITSLGPSGPPVGNIQYAFSQPAGICPGQKYHVKDCGGGLIQDYLAGYPAMPITEAGLGANVLVGRKVSAEDVNGASALSSCSQTYTDANPPGPFASASISTGSMALYWGAAGNPAYTRYELGLYAANFATFVSSPLMISSNFTASTFTVGNLQPGTTYFWIVRAFNGRATDGLGSRFTAAVSTAVPTLPSPPAGLTGLASGPGAVTWTWSSASSALDYVLMSDQGALLFQGSALSATQNGLSANTPARARIFAHNQSGMSAGSGFVNVFSSAAAPTGTAVTAVSSGSVTLAWSGGANPASTNYQIFQASDPFFGGLVSTVSVSGNSATISGLLPATQYYFRVRALNGDGVPTTPDAAVAAATNAAALDSQSQTPPTVYASTPNAVGIWHFDEGSGTLALDSSGAGNNAFLFCSFSGCISTPTYTGSLSGLGTALSFAGFANSIATAADSPGLDSAGALTVDAWVNPSSALQLSSATIISKGTGTYESFGLDIVASASNGRRFYRFFVRDGATSSQSSVYSTQTINVNAWQHVAGVYDPAQPPAGQLSLYVDGVRSATGAGPPSGAKLVNGAPLTIGGRQSGSGNYDLVYAGLIDEVHMINQAYNPAQIALEYGAALPAALTQAAPNNGLRYVIPPNAFGGPATLYVSNDPVRSPILVSPAAVASALANPPTGQALVPGSLVEIVALVNGLPFSGPLGSSVTISIPYPDALGTGIVDGTIPPIPAAGLRMYTLNPTVVRWDALLSTVDTANRRVTALTPHFSVFALFGPSGIASNARGIRVYPVPWKPNSGTNFDSVTFAGRTGLAFDSLPQQGDIRIYTLAGELVKDLSFTSSDAGTAIWDGKNSAGRNAASGIYFAYVRSASGSAILKFAVER